VSPCAVINSLNQVIKKGASSKLISSTTNDVHWEPADRGFTLESVKPPDPPAAFSFFFVQTFATDKLRKRLRKGSPELSAPPQTQPACKLSVYQVPKVKESAHPDGDLFGKYVPPVCFVGSGRAVTSRLVSEFFIFSSSLPLADGLLMALLGPYPPVFAAMELGVPRADRRPGPPARTRSKISSLGFPKLLTIGLNRSLRPPFFRYMIQVSILFSLTSEIVWTFCVKQSDASELAARIHQTPSQTDPKVGTEPAP